MTPLKEQTVYIPQEGKTVILRKSELITVDLGNDEFEIVTQKQLICLSKEELIEILGLYRNRIISSSTPQSAEQFINTILAV